MKILPAHLEYMRAAIAPHDTPEARAAYRAAGLSDKRYRWDLSYRAEGLTPWICANVYSYADDAHIDTALRAIVAPLTEGIPA